MKRSQQIVVAALGFLMGIALAQFYLFSINAAWLGVFAFGCVALLVVRSRIGLIILVGLGIMVGVGRYELFVARQPAQSIDRFYYEKVVVTGVVDGEPSWDDRRQYIFYLKDLRIDGVAVPGSLRIHSLVGSAREGYRIETKGKLYPSLGKAGGQLYYAPTLIVDVQVPWYITLKQSFYSGLQIALGEKLAGFMMGLLIGARSLIGKDLGDALSTVGLSHMVAVSGYNLTIIVALLYRIIGRRWRWAGFVVASWFCAFFVIISGASASIVRAAVMLFVLLLCRHFGRRLSMPAALGIGAIVTVGFNPAYLLGDLGWQLSFLSLLGIILFAPVIQGLLPKRFGIITEIVAVTLAAQLTTAPLIAYHFGVLSLIGPLANVLIMPIVPILMLAGFVAGTVGVVLPGVAFALLTPIRFVGEQIIDLIYYLASLRWSQIGESALPQLTMLTAYSILLVFALIGARRRRIQSASNLI
ncbi:ComEC/Rec2 family competence protein [bacterium]|nr:ComEC/Rec2 family competence protein [bacterium]